MDNAGGVVIRLFYFQKQGDVDLRENGGEVVDCVTVLMTMIAK